MYIAAVIWQHTELVQTPTVCIDTRGLEKAELFLLVLETLLN